MAHAAHLPIGHLVAIESCARDERERGPDSATAYVISVEADAKRAASPEERRAYAIADNKIADNAGWDAELLALELSALAELDFDLDLTVFSTAEIDIILDENAAPGSGTSESALAYIPERQDAIISKRGDLWLLGRHRLLGGDALSPAALDFVMDGAAADLLFTDPPYNVRIAGNVCGLGKVSHREFAMASGEMTRDEFADFLTVALGAAADPGGIHPRG